MHARRFSRKTTPTEPQGKKPMPEHLKKKAEALSERLDTKSGDASVHEDTKKRKADQPDDGRPSKALKPRGNAKLKRAATPKASADKAIKPKVITSRKPRARKGATDKLPEYFTFTPPNTPSKKRVDENGDIVIPDTPAAASPTTLVEKKPVDEDDVDMPDAPVTVDVTPTLVDESEAASALATEDLRDQHEGSETGTDVVEERAVKAKKLTKDVKGTVLDKIGQSLEDDDGDEDAAENFAFSILGATNYPQADEEWMDACRSVETLREKRAASSMNTGTRLEAEV